MAGEAENGLWTSLHLSGVAEIAIMLVASCYYYWPNGFRSIDLSVFPARLPACRRWRWEANLRNALVGQFCKAGRWIAAECSADFEGEDG